MPLLNFNLSSVGLDVSDLTFKAVQLTSGPRGKRRIQSWGQVKLNPGIVEHGMFVDREQVIAKLGKLRQTMNGKITSPFTVVCLPETKTFLKVFTISKDNLDSQDEAGLIQGIESALPKEIPLTLESIIYDYQLIANREDEWEVLVGVAPRDIVLEYSEVLSMAGFKLLALEIEAQAITRALIPGHKHDPVPIELKKKSGLSRFQVPFLKKKTPAPSAQTNTSSAPTILIDLGATRSSIIIIQDGIIRFSRSIELSGQQMTDQIALTMKLAQGKAEQAKIVCGLDPKKCKGKIAPVFKTWVSSLVNEIHTTISYYKESGGMVSFEQILLCGGGAALVGLSDRLNKEFDTPVVVCDPSASFDAPVKGVPPIPAKSLPGFTTAIGLAMRSI